MSKSVFGEVLVELLEEHGVGTYELALRRLARQTGLNADLLIGCAGSVNTAFAGFFRT